MLKSSLIIVGGLLLAWLVIRIIASSIRGRLDADITVTIENNDVLVTHSGSDLEHAVLTIEGKQEIEIGTIPSGTHRNTTNTPGPATRVSLRASRDGRRISMHHMFVVAERRKGPN